MLAGRRHAVMARAAGAQYLRVVDSKYRRPHIARVAVLTDVAGLNVCGALARGFSTVVAAEAIAGDVDVIEIRRQPGDG